MFDREDDPLYLQSRLEAFIDRWHGDRKPWFGIAAEKIEQTRLPKPLAWLYGYAGEWHGQHYWDTLLGNQDCLVLFEELSISDGKLVFIHENQGVWQVGADSSGDDPAAWVRIDDGPWQPLDHSLTRFLVTFVLHETVFGCKHVAYSQNVIAQLTDAGMHVAPLWLNHPYPAVVDGGASRPLTFHVANGAHLIMDNEWCATNADSPWEALPEIFKPKAPRPPSVGFTPYEPMPDHLQVPSVLRKSHLQNAIRLHEAEVKYHQGRCALYQKMLADMNEETTG
jgi:hypothetical protein